MKHLHTSKSLIWLSMMTVGMSFGWAQVWINEVAFNPPDSDAPNAYVELRGTPNLVLGSGTYFVAVDGDLNANPGLVLNIFDLSGKSIGGNGFLVLLQKANGYAANSNATLLVNTGSDPGFGNGSGSSINHRGADTDLPHAPVTFFLLQTTNALTLETDIDADNDGDMDQATLANWSVLDSIGVMGNNGIGYGAMNFRKAISAYSSQPVDTLGFTANYVGRAGNTTGTSEGDWVVSRDMVGTSPNWSLAAGTNTVPFLQSGAPLNHIGSPNFGAPLIPGIVLRHSGSGTTVNETGGTDTYTLVLNTPPAGNVTVQVAADPQLQVSTDGGSSFGSPKTFTFSSTNPKTITVRAVNDNVLAYWARIRHTVTSSADPAQYPTSTLGPVVQVNIQDNEWLLLNELKVDPPGTTNAPYIYFELRGSANMALSNVYLVALEGDADKNEGTVEWVVDLSGKVVGSSGLLVITSTNCPYAFPAGTTVVRDPQLNAPGGAFGKNAISFLLLASPVAPREGEDWDNGNNGVLEGVPEGAVILDAVGWTDGDGGDIVYGGATISQSSRTPDAVTRFPTNSYPYAASAWFFGSLLGPESASLFYDPTDVSPNFPFGSYLTPGAANSIDIAVGPLEPLSGVIDDPTNPKVSFYVSASGANPDTLSVSAVSSNPSVVSNQNITITAGPNGLRTLTIVPHGIGYGVIIVTVRNGPQVGQMAFPYAASAMGRPGGRFHTQTSDTSGAFALDDEWMLVGDDQNTIIRKYRRDFSGPPLDFYDFKPQLEVTMEENGEVDIEASTHVANRIFWLGSHSHNNRAEARTNRTRIFATDLVGSGSNATLTFAGMYKFLKVDVLNWDMTNGHGKGTNYYGLEASAGDQVDPKADDGSGFNFEGLTMAPGSSTVAWLGFRAPLVPVTNRARALIIPILNFASLAVSGAGPGAAVIGTPIELNLGCRGIRSMEANTNGLMIVAGPPGNANPPSARDFKFYTWTGRVEDLPQEHAGDLSGLNPEALVELPPSPWNSLSAVQLLTDSGNTVYYGDDIPAKHLSVTNFKKFRSDWITLGDVAVPQPCIKFLIRTGNTMTICWCSKPGLYYRVQSKSDLNEPTWTDVTGRIQAVDATTLTTVPFVPGVNRFFCVKVEP